MAAEDGSHSSSFSSVPLWKYHVFLSFRGEDIRGGFLDQLYAALQWQGMITFREEEELEKEVVSPAHLKAIEDSLSAIVILSPNYVSSTRCLDELWNILQSKKNLQRDVFPIFYGVDPFEAQHQRGRFGEAFRKLEGRFREDKEKVQKWRKTLNEVANLPSWNCNNLPESELIEDIIDFVWAELCPKLPSYNDNFIGIDSMIENIDLLSENVSQDVRFIGFWGIEGIGKTTLARVIYERFRANFEIDCFLDNVTEVSMRCGLVHLQQKLLSHRKLDKFHIDDIYTGKRMISNILHNRRVILVLDDVSDRSHLENLAENQVWFGQGSIVIITTRDLQLLEAHGIQETYKIECLNVTESLRLFCQKTFGCDQPKEGYLELSEIVVQYARGIPLALSVLGSFLCGRSLSEWEDALDEITQIPDNDILEKLRISYDRLQDVEKTIFLDIACFFKGMKKDDVTKILKNCGLDASAGIRVLIEKSLVISNGWTLEMHDLLQKMGREIVFQESLIDIGRRSRLWSIEDIDHVLGDKRGTAFIHGIVLESSPETYEAYLDPEAFSSMPNLKLLMISKVHLLSGLAYFPNSLKVLAWDGYPLEALPFGMQVELVDLKMHHSKIIQPWNEIQFFRKLKSIDLCYSKDLTQTPIVSGAPHLEQLILQGCTNLVEVHRSVGQHKKLVELNMKNCINLKVFPSKLEMDSLKDFILSGCSKVEKLPEFGENMKSLVMLDLKDCKNLLCLASTICNLKSLEILNISGCSKISRLPNNMNQDQPSDELDVSGTTVSDMIFTTISHLPLLKELDLSYCNFSDGSIPYDLSGFPLLWRLSLNGNNFSYLPDNFVANLSKLRFLELNDCSRLQKLPILPQDLRELRAKSCASLEPVFHPLQLWNFLALDDKMESSSLPRSTITGSEIPPWFEYQNYVSLDREFAHMDLDSIISTEVHIPHHCLTSEWWRIDLCLVLEYVTSDPLEDTSATVYWTVLATEPGFPSHRDFVCIPTDEFHTPHLYITSLRGLQEQLRGDSDQLEIRIGSKTQENGKMKIRKCGCHVYCKDDVEVWHRAKASIDFTFSPSASTSTALGISFPNLLTSLDTTSDDAMNSRDTSPIPQLRICEDAFLDNEMENISDDAMDSRDISLQPQLQMSTEHILDDEKENTSDDTMKPGDSSPIPQLKICEDEAQDNEMENISDDGLDLRDTSVQTQLLMSKDHILNNEKKNTNDDEIKPRDTTLQRQIRMSEDHVKDDEKENTSDYTMKPRDSFHQLQMSSNDHILDDEREIIGDDSINSRDASKDHVLDNEKKNPSDDAIKPSDTTLRYQLQMSEDSILDNEKKNISEDAEMSRDKPLQPQLLISNYPILDNEKENICSSSSVRVTKRFNEKIPFAFRNFSSPNASRISDPNHPTTNHQNLQKFPMRSNDVIYPRSSLSMRPIGRFSTSTNSRKRNALKISNLIHRNTIDQNLRKLPMTSDDEIKTSSMPNPRLSETSRTRPKSLTCLCEKRAALKVSHAGKSYYVCHDNKCNYIELSCPEGSVFTRKYQSFEISHGFWILLLTNFILSLCVFIFFIFILFSFGK